MLPGFHTSRYTAREEQEMTGDSVRDDDSVQVAARNVLMGAAPERDADLDILWRQLDPIFQVAPDIHEGDRVIMDAGAYRYVRFNHRVLRAFWIAGLRHGKVTAPLPKPPL